MTDADDAPLRPPLQDGHVTYRVLGPLQAWRHGPGGPHPLELGPPKQRAVLGVLLLHHGRAVPTSRLIDALWGDAAPPSAVPGLHAYISNLRRILRGTAGAGPAIVRRTAGYAIDAAPESVDAVRFTRTVEDVRTAVADAQWENVLARTTAALELWTGDVLEDFRDEPWRAADAERLGQLQTECREASITAMLAERRLAPALAAALELRASHPLRDRGCWLLMVALHQAGRSTDALEHYRAHLTRLDEEIGVAPGAELRRLEVAILNHDPALESWPRTDDGPVAAVPGEPTPVAQSALQDDAPAPLDRGSAAPSRPLGGERSTLVGRERERRLLADAIGVALRGSTRWVLLSGPAGIGKTRLAEEVGQLAQADGAREIWSRCSDEDGAPAWWAIRQIVRGLGHDPDEVLRPSSAAAADEGRFALYERVTQLLRASCASDGPLAIVVDDVQWTDATSSRCLAHLVGALGDLPLAIVLTMRSDEDDRDVAALLQALARSDRSLQLSVGPLHPDDVAALAAEISGAPLPARRAVELAAHTEGNPLFVSEFARLPAEERDGGSVPLAVRTVLGRRLSGLEPEIIGVLRAAAVCGDPIDLTVMAAVTGTDPDTLADLLDDAAADGVLVVAHDTGGYAFVHGLLRQEILRGTPATRRQRMHARAAEALADAADVESVSRRARHLLDAMPFADPASVLDACRAAAVLAEERWSSDTAASWWAAALRAFDLLPGPADPEERDRLLVARVFALARAGRGQTVLDTVDESLLDAVRAGRRETVGRLAAALLRSAGGWPWPAYGTDPRALLERLDGLCQFVTPDPVAQVRVLAALAVGRSYDDDPAVRDHFSSSALRIASSTDARDALPDALLGRLITFSGTGTHDAEAVEHADRLSTLRRPDEHLRRVDAAIGQVIAVLARFSLGQVHEAEIALRDAISEAEVLELPVIRLQMRWLQGTLAHWRGDLTGAAEHYSLAGRLFAQTENYHPVSGRIATLTLALDAGELGRHDLTDAPAPDVWAAAQAARHDPRRTVELTERWTASLTTWTWMTLGHLVVAAHALADAAAAGPAERVLELLGPHAGRLATVGQVGALGPVDLAIGRLHVLLGDAERGRTHLERAHALARSQGGPRFAVRCREALDTLTGTPT